MNYSNDIIAQVKLLYIEKNYSAAQIADHFGGSPHRNTILNWAKKKDEHGKTWEDYRREDLNRRYESLSPSARANAIFDDIDKYLKKPDRNTKDADAIAKLSKVLELFINMQNNLPVIFSTLTEFSLFVKKKHPDLFDNDFVSAIIEFKNHKRGQFENSI